MGRSRLSIIHKGISSRVIKMKIELLPKEISKYTPSENQIFDESTEEAVYYIRALRAGIDLCGETIEISPEQHNSFGQVFIESHDIWISNTCWQEA
jgi:hypothetical protein